MLGCLLMHEAWSLRISLGTLVLFLFGSVAAMLWLPVAAVDVASMFVLDTLAAPLLPVFALVHLLSHLGTAKTVTSTGYCIRSLLAAGLSALALCCHDEYVLLALLVLTVMLPLWELRERGRSSRTFVVYM